jgi:ATP/maltotriose-dependent transcriptional regulator MalT
MTIRKHIEFHENSDANPQLNCASPSYTDKQIGATAGMDVVQVLAPMEDELQRCRSDLEKIKTELLHSNYALSTLARNLREKHHDFMKKVTANIAHRVLPAIDEVAQSKMPENVKHQLNMVRLLVNNIVPISQGRDEVVIPVLSKTELRVANMIKNGLKTSDIARLLCVSELTVKTHRRNIRKKLKINSPTMNLSSTLKLILSGSN